jgi:ribonuclease VapC
LIVLDSSAVVALMRKEPAAAAISALLVREPDERLLMSSANYVEVGAVMAGHAAGDRRQAIRDLDAFLAQFDVELAPVDGAQARLAVEARISFGKGFGGPGKLNYGDCFAYALAKSLNAPLLFTGDDFAKTDVLAAL